MVKSMTGYGRAQLTAENYDITVEIKSVNHRYSDFNFRVPRSCVFLEDTLKNYLKNYISRGKTDVLVSIHKHSDDSKQITLNSCMAKGYIDALKALSHQFDLEDDITASTIAQYNDIFEVSHKEEDEKQLTQDVTAVLEEAVKSFMDMRRREGEKLCSDMLARNADIRTKLERVEHYEPQAVAQYREKLEQRIKELIGDAEVDESRLLTETAILADKLSITEEVIRLRSHLDEFERVVRIDEPIGRKLDFLLQEMNREINTIGSKSNCLDISKLVVDIKAELEKIREQLQNVE